MDETYDVIVLGTGLTECVISGICSATKQLKVLHMDRNSYYGGEATSMTLDQLYKEFKMGDVPCTMGKIREWNVDLIPKFLMADGKLVKLLIATGVTKYLEFKCAEGSFVYKRGGKVHKVPSNATEAAKTPLVGFMEKRRLKNFLEFVYKYDEKNPTTQDGIPPCHPMTQLYAKYSLSPDTQSFVGHAMALFRNDEYLNEPSINTINKIKLYLNSVGRYGASPYLYPLYGLGELPQGFARRCAVYGGTYMLNKPIENIKRNEESGLIEVTSEGETVKGKMVVGDPSYFLQKVKKVGKVVRAICILNKPIDKTSNAASCQIIIPQSEVNRHHDIYILMVSSTHKICVDKKFVAIVSTIVETEDPEKEIEPGLSLLGPIEQKFISVKDLVEPTDDGVGDKMFVSRSYDATTHFETTCDDIIDLYKRMFNEEFEFDKMKHDLQEEAE